MEHIASFAYHSLPQSTFPIGFFNPYFDAQSGYPVLQAVVEPLERWRQITVVLWSGPLQARATLVFYQDSFALQFDPTITTLAARHMGINEIARVPLWKRVNAVAPAGLFPEYSLINHNSQGPSSAFNQFVQTPVTMTYSTFAAQPTGADTFHCNVAARLVEVQYNPGQIGAFATVMGGFLRVMSSNFSPAMVHRQDMQPIEF